ncbi:MAG: insulinase family protein [Oscillospiraceae bacterium]|nr:insulinase family protein [Oscillospiraceae bacterium]
MNREIKEIKSERLGNSYYKVEHPSGLTILMAPMEGFSTAYAMFGTAYGSIDTCIKTSEKGDFIKLPEGIAHYLEHKLFESEECSAFERYAKTGANANAFTAFDRTAYLFACSDNFAESMEILLDFVTHPYFTPETVAKEQGIIGQEIRMYDDSADWRVLFNLLGALYHKNPVKIDIAGTTESIAKITADLLYECYNTFYNLHNMVLTVAGNFDMETVLKTADAVLEPAKDFYLEHGDCGEPEEVVKNYAEQHLPVSVPLFNVGFKGKTGTEVENFRGSILDEIFAEALCSDYTALYRELYDEGIINATFGSEVFCGRDYISILISGESREPEKVYKRLKEEFEHLLEHGIPKDIFTCAQRSVYGHYMRSMDRVTGVATSLFNCHFPGVDMYEMLDIAANATPESVIERIKTTYGAEKSALSVIKP